MLKKKQKRKEEEEEEEEEKEEGEEEENVTGCRKYGLYLHIKVKLIIYNNEA